MGKFSYDLKRPLLIGDKIYVEGKVAKNAEIFSIALVSEYKNGEPWDVLLNYKAYLNTWKGTINIKKDGVWTGEEEAFFFPFQKGGAYELTIEVLPEEYTLMVKCNIGQFKDVLIPNRYTEKLCCDYDWTFNIWEGHGKVSRVGYQKANCSQNFTIYKLPSNYTTSSSSFGSFNFPLTRPPKPGDKFYLEGLSQTDADKFAITLIANYKPGQKWDTSKDIPFHYVADMNEKTATLSYKLGGEWKETEEIEFIPIEKGKKFYISLNAVPGGFKLYGRTSSMGLAFAEITNRRFPTPACDYGWALCITQGFDEMYRGIYDTPTTFFSKRYLRSFFRNSEIENYTDNFP